MNKKLILKNGMIFIKRDTVTAGLGLHVTICLVQRLSQDALQHHP